MKIVYRKSVAAIMLILSVLYFALGIANVFNAVFESERFSFFVFLCWLTPLVFLAEGLAWFLLFFHYRKGTLNVAKSGKWLGAICFVSDLVFLLWGFLSSITVHYSVGKWPWWASMVLGLLAFVLSLVFLGITKRLNKDGYTGFSLYRNHARAFAVFAAWDIFLYAASFLKLVLMAIIMEETTDPEAVAFAQTAYVVTLFTLLIVTVIFTLLIFYFGFAQFISGKENVPVEFRRGFAATKKLFAKYEITFWIGIVATVILGILAYISTMNFGSVFYGLLALYVITLVIRVPSSFWRKHLETKYRGDDYKIFTEKHRIVIFIGFNLLILGVLSSVFGMGFSRKLTELYNPLIVYVIFVPYSITRIVLGILGFKKARHLGDPYIRANSYVDIMISIFALANLTYILASFYSAEKHISEAWLTAGKIISYFLNSYVILVSIYTIVVGFLGLKGKREATYKKHERRIKWINSFRFEKLIEGPLEEAGIEEQDIAPNDPKP